MGASISADGLERIDPPRGERAPILAVLRERTRAEHGAIERSLGLMSDTLSRGEYLRIVERFHGFWRPLEQRLAQTSGLAATGVDPASRQRAHLLLADLSALNEDAAPEPAASPLCADLPFVGSVPAALGAMYVLEGASLGGQLISRHLRARLGITPERGGRFFHGYGERTGEMWRAFGAAVSALVLTAEMEDAMVQAAVATFRTLGQWCEGTPATS
jgi:heme oxygenase